jgi:hypothetical protein
VEALKAEGWTLCVEQLPDASKQIVNVVFGDGLFCCMHGHEVIINYRSRHEIPPADHVVAWRMPLPPIVYEVRV